MSGSKGWEYINSYFPTNGQMAIDGGTVGVNDVLMDNNTAFVLRSDHDTALRAAKVEVLRDLRNTFAPCATGDTRENVDGCGNYDDYYSAGGNDAYRDVVKEIDARAAQIEEGE